MYDLIFVGVGLNFTSFLSEHSEWNKTQALTLHTNLVMITALV
jgi:hypothetical protein